MPASVSVHRLMLSNRSMPDAAVIPELHATDVRVAAKWLCDAFGFSIRIAIGLHRAQLNAGTGAIVLTERSEASGGAVSLMVRVDNVDDHYAVAKRHGATIVIPPEDYPYGERQYVCEDPEGHRWTFSQTIADVAPETWGGTPDVL